MRKSLSEVVELLARAPWAGTVQRSKLFDQGWAHRMLIGHRRGGVRGIWRATIDGCRLLRARWSTRHQIRHRRTLERLTVVPPDSGVAPHAIMPPPDVFSAIVVGKTSPIDLIIDVWGWRRRRRAQMRRGDGQGVMIPVMQTRWIREPLGHA
jgi:hypothetical protein